MPDLFTTLATSPVARRVGVPQPTRLRRFAPGEPLCDSPVLVAGGGAFAGAVRDHLASLGVTTVDALEVAEVAEGAVDGTPPVTDAGRLGAVVLDLSAAVDLGDLDRLRTLGAPAVRRLARNARVVVVGRDPDTVTDLEAAVTQRALEGFVRSLGKELRDGATANLVLAQGGRPDGVVSAASFFLSGRSAYVDGQVVVVDDTPTPASSTTLLAGRVAVVTGAARGIGADIARVLARDGARVVAVDVPSAGQALAAVANEVGGTALQLDITAPDAGARIVEHARGRHGGLDVVVHNAGITRDRLLVNLDEQQWSSVVDVNLRSVLRMNQALLAEGGLGDGGRIVCVSSIAGLAGNRGQSNYAVSKAGVVGLVHALSRRVAGRGITVNAVAPGFIETEMTARIPFATREVGRRMNSLQQAGLPLDVAEAVCWLAQPTSGAVTGQVLRVCGQSLLGA